MKTTSFRRAIVPGVAALAITLTACGAGNEASSGDSGDSGSSSSLSGELVGGGASSQEKAEAAWVAGFQGENPDVTVTYDPVGSGTGRENFVNAAYSFAGTDSAINDEEGELTAATERCAGSGVIQVPAYVSPIAVIYNLPNVDELNLSPETISAIFSGEITSWNDPAIVADNPNADLPDTAITPVHRQDDSGTTENFVKYLEEAGDWQYEADDAWPADIKGGEAAEGTSGVVGAVSGGEGTIGYADHSAAEGVGVASVKVGEEYVQPTAEGAAKVVAISPRVEGTSDTDMAVELARDTDEAGAYPVVLISYLLACSTYSDQAEADLVKGYLTYVLSDAGQQAAAGEAGSAPLDSKVAADATALVEAITAG